MTFFAGDGRVEADEWKPRDIVIEGDFLAPARLLVTLLAPRAELTFVGIGLAVAARTIGRQLVAVEISRMARIAFDGRVLAAQRKLGRFIVIEADRRPLRRGMAGFAFLSVTARMLVLLGMTTRAGHPNVLVALSGMASAASDRLVSANEDETGLVMIEGFGLPPCFLVVAILAERAQAPFVRLGLFVTIDAAARRLAERFIGLVAARARSGFVGAIELKVRQRVIEGFAIEPDDVGRAALVVGVTVLAVALQRIFIASVEAALPLPIAGDVFMAFEAQFRL